MLIQEFLTQNNEEVISFQALLWLKELSVDLKLLNNWNLSKIHQAILDDSMSYAPKDEKEELMIGISRQSISIDRAAQLELFFEGNIEWWIQAAKYHVSISSKREDLARIRLSQGTIPFVFPGDLLPIHVEVIAAGKGILSVLHADLNRKLSDLVLRVFPLDAKYLGVWLLPLLPVLNENVLKKHIKNLLRKSKNNEAGLVSLYAQYMGIDHHKCIVKASKKSTLLYLLGRELAQKIV